MDSVESQTPDFASVPLAASAEPATHILDERGPANERPSQVEGGGVLHAGRACCPGKGCARPSCRARRTPLGSRRRVAETRSISRAAGADASARARPDPVRAHAGVAVRLLPRRRVSDGGRSRGWATHGIAGAALRRRAPLQLRDLRGTGSEACLQHQRLRRDAAGTFEWDVKRLAASLAVAGRELGFDGAIRRSVVTATVREYREAMSALRGDAEHSTSGTHASMSRRSRNSSGQGCPGSR